MLDRIAVTAAVFVAAISAISSALPVLLAAKQQPATEWRGGLMLRGTLHDDRFAIAQAWPERRGRLEVVFHGRLPATVCEGVAVAIGGWPVDDHFEAAEVVADRSKYDACWEWQCFPIDERPPSCRRHDFE